MPTPNDELYVNLFIASNLRWKDKGVMLTQKTAFPDVPRTTFEIKPERPTAFTLKLRYPSLGRKRKTADGR